MTSNRDLQYLQTVNKFATSLLQQKDSEDVLWEIAHEVINSFGFEDCVIYLLDKNKSMLLQKAAFGPKNPDKREIKDPIIIPVGQGIVGAVAKS